MEWNLKDKYKPYEQWDSSYLNKIQNEAKASPWRTKHHIEPNSGLLNDPNGFSWFNGNFHLFYQYFPYGPVHGLKSWRHLISKDLVHFKHFGDDIFPDTKLDSHGTYSGTAIEINNKLYIVYTGNVRDENWLRHSYHVSAWMDKRGNITKTNKILIDTPNDVTNHFRDPNIFRYKGNYYCIVGAQNLRKQGLIKLYKTKDDIEKPFDFVGDLNFKNSYSAYMIECPNLVFIEKKPVLIYCPQGLSKSVLDYKNIHPNVYRIAKSFDENNSKLTDVGDIQLLDYGLDCYATQAFNAPDGNVYSISWLGLPDVAYETEKYNYFGCLSFVRKLNIIDGFLTQTPVESIYSLRTNAQPLSSKENTDNCYELNLEFSCNENSEIILFADKNNNGLKIKYCPTKFLFEVDRSACGNAINPEYGSVRSCKTNTKNLTAQIFVDKSTFEIFLDSGKQVLSGRVFPNKDQNGIKLISGQIKGKYFQL